MHRLIDPATRQVIAKDLRHLLCQCQLPRPREMPGQHGCRGRIAQGGAQIHQPGPHPVKQRRNLGPGDAGLIPIQKRVISITAIGQSRSFGAAQIDDLPQHRQKARQITSLARCGPFALRYRGDARDFGGQIPRHAARTGVAMGNQAQLRGLGLTVGDGLIQPFPHTRIGAPRMQNTLQRRHFFAALMGRPARHHGFLVPAQTPHHLAQRLGLALKGQKIAKRAHALAPFTLWTTGYMLKNRARSTSVSTATAPS